MTCNPTLTVKVGRLDREGRDYWVKPLREIGAIQECTYVSDENVFVRGHIKAKSPNSSYRLDPSFINLLQNRNSEEFEELLEEWTSNSIYGIRIQAKAARMNIERTDNPHVHLIQDSINIYARNFLPDYEALYVDSADADQVTTEEKKYLNKITL